MVYAISSIKAIDEIAYTIFLTFTSIFVIIIEYKRTKAIIYYDTTNQINIQSGIYRESPS